MDLFKMLLSKDKLERDIAKQAVDNGSVRIKLYGKFCYCWGNRVRIDNITTKKERRLVYDMFNVRSISYSIEQEVTRKNPTLKAISPTKYITYYLVIKNQY